MNRNIILASDYIDIVGKEKGRDLKKNCQLQKKN